MIFHRAVVTPVISDAVWCLLFVAWLTGYVLSLRNCQLHSSDQQGVCVEMQLPRRGVFSLSRVHLGKKYSGSSPPSPQDFAAA